MDFGVFLPIANNGWIPSATSPQYLPTFELNHKIVKIAENLGFKFALSMSSSAATAGRPRTGITHSNRSP
jgi:pyrimidine oxygenase